MTFVLLVLLSFFVLHEIDQVLKGRPKWYEKSSKRKVYYKGPFETGSSKVELLIRSPDWKFLNTLWICNRVDAKCYPDIFFRWRNKIQPSSLPWILCSRWQPRSKVFSRALNSALTRLYDACSVANISRGVVGTGVNPDTCGRANSTWKRIRMDVEIFESGKK